MTIFRAVLTKLNKIIEYTLAALSLVLTTIIFVQVMARYVFTAGVGWSDELARFIFIWMVFLGGSVAVHHKANMFIETFVNLMSTRYRRVCRIVSSLLCMYLFGCMIYYGLNCLSIVQYQKSSGLVISMAVPYSCIPLSGLLMLIYTFADFVELICNKQEGRA